MSISRVVCSFLCICFIDYMIIHIIKNKDNSSRWFMLHFSVNCIVTILSSCGLVNFLQNPLMAMMSTETGETLFSAESKWPLTLVVCLHLYHCLKFNLSLQDVLHHFLFIPTLGIPGIIYDWGCFANYLTFFICGLPGGIDYFILSLHKQGIALQWNQKKICANLNMWLRLPGILLGIGVAFVIFKEKKYTVHPVPFLVQVTLMPINVIYYAKQSVINYTLHQIKKNTFCKTLRTND